MILHLETLGLISFSGAGEFNILRPINEIVASYFGREHNLSTDSARQFAFGRIVFSSAGLELFRVSGAERNDAIERATLAAWERNGWREASPNAP
jgi:hypothetical protein